LDNRKACNAGSRSLGFFNPSIKTKVLLGSFSFTFESGAALKSGGTTDSLLK
jgi:hypothetical protein